MNAVCVGPLVFGYDFDGKHRCVVLFVQISGVMYQVDEWTDSGAEHVWSLVKHLGHVEKPQCPSDDQENKKP